MSEVPPEFYDKDFRRAWLEREINVGLATQIRAMREQRGWTQAELGRRLGMAQERISLLEDPTYGRYTIRTLKRIASVFDVALLLRFGPWSAVLTGRGIDWSAAIPSFDDEVRAGVL